MIYFQIKKKNKIKKNFAVIVFCLICSWGNEFWDTVGHVVYSSGFCCLHLLAAWVGAHKLGHPTVWGSIVSGLQMCPTSAATHELGHGHCHIFFLDKLLPLNKFLQFSISPLGFLWESLLGISRSSMVFRWTCMFWQKCYVSNYEQCAKETTFQKSVLYIFVLPQIFKAPLIKKCYDWCYQVQSAVYVPN